MLFRYLRLALTTLFINAISHWLIGRWGMRAFPSLRARRRALRIAYGVVLVLPVVFRVASDHVQTETLERINAAAMLEFMLAAITAIPLGLVEIARAIARRKTLPPDPGTPDAALTRREVTERAFGLAVAGATTSVLGWGMVRGRHAFAIEEVVVRIPGLPRVLDGYTIAQISDLHVGLFVSERELKEGLDRVREVRPDLLVATGDLVDINPRFAPMMARFVSDVQARDGVVAILGNHDYYTGQGEVRRALADANIDLLVNAGRRIRPGDGGGFALLGVDDRWAASYGGSGPDLKRAIAMVPPDAPRILLSHQPVTFDRHAGQVALQLSGHTHGGQINPGIRPARLLMTYVEGRYEKNGSTLWVNRGFGVAGPPARIGAPPEVTKIVLVSA
jgi:predicted MPP superfamily phosphohydrolase